MSFFVEVLNVFRIMLAAHFLLIWTTITTAVAICVAWTVGQATTPRIAQSNESRSQSHSDVATGRDALELSRRWPCWPRFWRAYIAMTLAWEDFAYYDNSCFTPLHAQRP